MALVPALLLAAAIDGHAALAHASALAALGPHPWGSPRAAAAAEYVAAEFRRVGLAQVHLQRFESHGTPGANVIGVLRAPGPEFVVVGAHHDTAPEAPGAYDDGGGVGVLIELARVLVRRPTRPRTVVFVSWDGEEAWSTGRTTPAGSRAYIAALGPEARHLVAALDLEMCGWAGGTPVVHAMAYPDPLRPGSSVVAPGWLVRAALTGSARAGAPLRLGDPRLSWLYQPAVRAFRTDFYGDDLPFLEAGLPALFVSDSSLSASYPAYHRSADTADRLDAPALARLGQGALGVVSALQEAAPGHASDPAWFAAFGVVLGGLALLSLGLASLLPGLVAAGRSGGRPLAGRLVHGGLFGVLLWSHPVPALWVFTLPNLLGLGGRRRLRTLLALVPAATLAGFGLVAWRRGFVSGLWLRPWELGLAAAALALLYVGPSAGSSATAGRRRRVRS